jgi:5-methylcytosine-specific restriction endonuclease McrA
MRQRYEIPQPGRAFDPAIYRLGKPCQRNHLWNEGVTLRTVKNGKCPICDRIDALDGHARRKAADPEGYKAKQKASVCRSRELHGRESRSKYGLPHSFLEANGFNNGQAQCVVKLLADGLTVQEIKQRLDIDARLRSAGNAPTVARLVYNQQLEHWRAHPKDRAEFVRQYAQWRHHWNYAISLRYRLYHRAKAKVRKTRERGSRTVMLSPDQLWRRWVEFDHRCAYCGTGGDLQVEHVIPISQGGEHHLGNIVPACQRCNYSKGSSAVMQWYKTQPFFNETRWLAILEALDRGQPDTEQLVIPEIPCGATGFGLGSSSEP